MVEEKAGLEENEEITEDFCFCCKDGGELLLCDYKGCLKAYHPKCVGKDNSILDSAVMWTCGWHSCLWCKKSSKYQCFLCQTSYCEFCIWYAEADFASIRGNKGFCDKCAWLAKLIEDNNVHVDSDGGRVNFDDQSSVEWLFKEYWLMRKEKERLTSEDVYSADKKLRKRRKPVRDYNYELEEDEEAEEFNISDEDDDDDDFKEDEQSSKRKRSKEKHVSKKNAKEKEKKEDEFVGWASKSLTTFLRSIGKDTNEKLYEVTSIITRYCEENKLFHPEKRKQIVCDEMLHSLLGRKVVSKNKIYDRLETHFAENMEQIYEDELKSSSEDEDVSLADGKQKFSTCNISAKNEVVSAVKYSDFPSIVPKNINLAYLRKSLVEKLLEQPETFDSKVTGSFVRVKSDPNDVWQKTPYMILQVKGIKKISGTADTKSSLLLQVSNMLKDIPVCKLLDDDISEEECKDLHQRMVQGLLKRPSVSELQEKVKSLHKDITKHRIERELYLLKHRIDRENEQGRRREMFEYVDRKKLLETPSEQARMLEEVPQVVAEIAESEPNFEDCSRKDEEEINNGSAEVSIRTSKASRYSYKENWASCSVNGGTNTTGEKQQQTEECVFERSPSHHQVLAPENDHPAQRDPSQSLLEAKHESSKTSIPENVPQNSHSDIAGGKPESQATVQKLASQAKVIELSDDDDGDARAPTRLQGCFDAKWHCVSPNGLKKSPYPLSVLKEWRRTENSGIKWKAWKESQSQEAAMCLDDILRHAFPEN